METREERENRVEQCLVKNVIEQTGSMYTLLQLIDSMEITASDIDIILQSRTEIDKYLRAQITSFRLVHNVLNRVS